MGILGVPKMSARLNNVVVGSPGARRVVMDPKRVRRLEELRCLAMEQERERTLVKAERKQRKISGNSSPSLVEEPVKRAASPLRTRSRERATTPGTRATTPGLLAVDWRTLAACEVVLDHEDERKRAASASVKLQKMRRDLDDQLSVNARRRAEERGQQKKWVREVSLETARVKQVEMSEAAAVVAKRKEIRAIFAVQAEALRASRASEKQQRDAEARTMVLAAQKSLDLEKVKEQRIFNERKVAQDKIKIEIAQEQTLKKKRRLEEWAENERIAKEANARADEIERRRAGAIAQREATMKKFEGVYAAGAGKKSQEAEKAAADLADRYFQEKTARDDAAFRLKEVKRKQAISDISRENEHQLDNRKLRQEAERAAKIVEKQRADAERQKVEKGERDKLEERMNKQMQLKESLAAQVQLAKITRDKGAVAMSSTERAFNNEVVKNVLKNPDYKDELKTLLSN